MFAEAYGHEVGGCRSHGHRRPRGGRELKHLLRMMAMAGEGTAEGEEGHRGGPHGHRGQRGPGVPWGPPFGGFGGGPFRRPRKARRGDIRTAALLLLAEEPRNGYQIMQEVQERSEGEWRPSPGSVYPALSQLEDEGLIAPEGGGEGKRFVLTDAGREYLSRREADAKAPWEHFSGDLNQEMRDLGNLVKEVAYGFAQIMRNGNETQLGEARKVLLRTKRDLYRILAGEELEADGGE